MSFKFALGHSTVIICNSIISVCISVCNLVCNYYENRVRYSLQSKLGACEWHEVPAALCVSHRKEFRGRSEVWESNTIYVDGQCVIFEFLPMLTHKVCHHYHTYALKSPPFSSRCMFLLKHSDLLDYHPYGLYHSTSVSTDTTLEYAVLKSYVYSPVS